MNDLDLLSATHFGFQKGRRCQEPAWTLTETIKYMARRGSSTFAAFIDVNQAHLTILMTTMMAPLQIKLSEAEGGGGNKSSRAWAVTDKMYKHCSSRIVINGHEPGDYVVKHGLWEGSVLNPFLYAIIDEMAKVIGAACAGVTIGLNRLYSRQSTHVRGRRCDNQ